LSPRDSEIGWSTFRPRGLKRLDSCFLNQIGEGGSAAVHDRHFRRAQFDDRVVDAQADEGRKQVFHRIHPDRVAHQASRVVDAANMADGGGYFPAAQI
jgi:hypothetical protein